MPEVAAERTAEEICGSPAIRPGAETVVMEGVPPSDSTNEVEMVSPASRRSP
jgi:hypothetical protein